VALSWGSHHTFNANSNVNGSAAAMGWRGTEKIERKGERLEMWLRGLRYLD